MTSTYFASIDSSFDTQNSNWIYILSVRRHYGKFVNHERYADIEITQHNYNTDGIVKALTIVFLQDP